MKINEDKQKIRIQFFKLLNWTAVKIGKAFLQRFIVCSLPLSSTVIDATS